MTKSLARLVISIGLLSACAFAGDTGPKTGAEGIHQRQPGNSFIYGLYSAIPATSLPSAIERESTMGSNIGNRCGAPCSASYAFNDEAGELSTNICARTTRLEKSRGNLTYPRGKRAAPAANKEASTTTSRLCGRVVPTDATGSIDSQVLLVRVGSKSPVPDSEAGLDRDGSFCVTDINPGKYHLLFANRIEEALTSFVHFPGVTDLSEATATVIPGHTPSDPVFNIPAQATFSVSDGVQLRQPPTTSQSRGDVDEREPTLARVHGRCSDEWLFCV
jgi:hypothetical protein